MWGHWGDEENDLVHLVADYGPYFEVGERFSYNGMDLALASKILEQITGEALPQFYHKRLFHPLGCRNTTATNSSSNARSTAGDMARIGQMLLNGGSYGPYRFFGADTRDAMLPVNLSPLLEKKTNQEWGIGCSWMDEEILGKGTYGHGSAASATLRVSPSLNLVVAMTRNTAGQNFDNYHPKFLQLVADCCVGVAAAEGARK